jgi:hypothetical protein
MIGCDIAKVLGIFLQYLELKRLPQKGSRFKHINLARAGSNSGNAEIYF